MIYRICAIALTVALGGLFLRESGGKYVPLLSVAGGLLLFGIFFSRITAVTDTLASLVNQSGAAGYLDTLLRVIAVGYTAEIGADICRDLGDAGSASKLELCGKLEILILCLPCFLSLVELAVSLVGG